MMPSAVIASDPAKCRPAAPSAHRYWVLPMSETISAEKVEKVVSPPMNPVMMNSRASGGRLVLCAK